MAEIKQSINSVQIVGTLKEINAKVETKEVTIRNGGVEKKVTCSQIAKAEFRNPMFTVEVNGNDIGVDYFPTAEKKLDDNGAIIDNPRYKSLETIINTYVPKSRDAVNATRVKVDGNLRLNEYPDGQTFEWKSFPSINAFQISSSGVSEEDIADAEISGVIGAINTEVIGDNETDRLIVTLYTFDNQGVVSPMKFIVEEDLASDFNSFYEIGDNTKLSYEIKTKQVGAPKTSNGGGFGRRESKMVRGFSITEYSIFHGDDKFEEENELFVSVDAVKEALDVRNIMIEKKIAEKKANPSTTSSTPSPKGASTKSSGSNPFVGGSSTTTETKKKNPFG